jgi:hypothetical protein
VVAAYASSRDPSAFAGLPANPGLGRR